MSTPTDSGAGPDTLPAFSDEVVTRAALRYLDPPGLDGRLALITLDNGRDHRRPNTFGPAGLAALDAALDEAYAAPGVRGVAVTGKPFILAAGADLTGIASITDRSVALEVGRMGHRVFRRLGEGPVPSFVFINGLALGGGVEIALHATYRTISSSVTALGLPECFLGLVPGWGGTALLPPLVGTEAAVTVILENPLANNRMLTGRQAFALGIADALFDPADFLEHSIEWAIRVLEGQVPVARREPDDEATRTAAIARGRGLVDARLHGATPAPYRALDLIAAHPVDRDVAFAAEDEALADLIMTEELRAGLYAFDLVQRRARHPAGAPDPGLARTVGKVGIVGAGLMASQLALLVVRRLKVPVVLTDLDEQRVARGVQAVQAGIDDLAARHRLSADAANRARGLVSGSTDLAVFANADLVIEAVYEELTVKQSVLADVESVVSPECVLATNTSSLSVSAMARGLAHPERVVGLHFFNPVAVLPLLEVARGEQTDEATLATAFAVSTGLRKNAILVADAPAFVVNRLLTRFLGEVTAAVDEGTPLEVADRALVDLGLPMSPFALLGLVGPAVALHVAETLHEVFPQRFAVSENLRRIVAAGKTGVYLGGAATPRLDPEVAALLVTGDRPSTGDQVRHRGLAALAEEIGLMLDDGVVAGPAEIDLAMILGAGWPFHLGGITPYLDRSGLSQEVTGRRFAPAGVATLPVKTTGTAEVGARTTR
ncbi:MAG: 3-hydroxyacyl-CoA dehydrogenase NAD-binding domain-containing protein [Actinomycetes bacterium]